MNREDFSTRVLSAQGAMHRVACAYLRGEHDRLDAVAEAVLKAWQKLSSLKDERYFETWLIRILIHECVNVQRAQKRMIPVETLPEEAAWPGEGGALRQALEALPQKLRIVTVLHYMEGYDVYDVARALGITKGAVCSRLARGREALRALLKEEIE